MLLSDTLIRQATKLDPRSLLTLREQRRTQTPGELEPPSRIHQRLRHALLADDRSEEPEGLLERIVNGNDLTGVNYLERGMITGKSVARVQVCDTDRNVIGFGTGFLIAPGVLLTNQHVFPNAGVAGQSLAEFDYETDVDGNDRQSFTYTLDPATLFYADVALDFAVVAVNATAREQARPLSDFSWLKLRAETGKALLAEYLTIIQHPGGQRKQVCVRENQLLKVDTDVVWYATDTLGGSSGSPVFNSSWQVVALHHLGVPKKDAKGNWLTVDGHIWDSSMDDSQVQWIANEGIRVSRIVDTLAGVRPGHPLLTPLFDDSRPPRPRLSSTAASAATPMPPLSTPAPMNSPTSATITIPLQITLSFGPGGLPSVTAPSVVLPSGSVGHRVAEPGAATEAISIDPNYANRGGFDPNFLGKGALVTPLPKLTTKQKADAARLLKPAGTTETELKYHHYSVVMNARRRTAFFAVVNIDGTVWRSITRETDRWILDPRIAASAQAGEEIYAANPLDRGHLVRRLDPAWGASPELAKVANDDTFHFTNCTPQHADFNEGKALWAGLEDYVLMNADKENLRVNVFNGPVFAADDAVYRGIQLPKQFWKIAVMVRAKKLHATAYLLSQAALIQNLKEADFAYGAYRTFQVPVKKVEQLTGLSFGKLSAADPLNGAKESTAPLEVSGYESIQF